jgi:hypothetical protein
MRPVKSDEPKKCLLVPGTSLFQRSFSMHHTHTNFLSFTCSTSKVQSKASSKSEAKIMQREHPNCTLFRIFFLSVRGGWRSCDFVAPQAGSMALGIHGADSNALTMAF